MKSKDEYVFKAKLAEAAGRYEDMAAVLEQLVVDFDGDSSSSISNEEIKLLKEAYENMIASRRASLRIISFIRMEQMHTLEAAAAAAAAALASKVENQLSYLTNKLDLISSVGESAEKLDDYRRLLRSDDAAHSAVVAAATREDCFQLAKVAGEALMYPADMLYFVRKGVSPSCSEELKAEERELVAAAYKRFICSLLTSCRVVSSHPVGGHSSIIRDYKQQLGNEGTDVCNEVVNLVARKGNLLGSKHFIQDMKLAFDSYWMEFYKFTQESDASQTPSQENTTGSEGGSQNLKDEIPVMLPHSVHAPSLSRFKRDFEHIVKIGSGGYGVVYCVTHKLDKHQYAVKIMKLEGNDSCKPEMAVREAVTMAKLNHPNIVRYHQAWFDYALDEYYKFTDEEYYETEEKEETKEIKVEDEREESEDFKFSDGKEAVETEEEEEADFLCIQMQFYPGSLNKVLTSQKYHFNEALAIHFFRQVVEGLDYLHGYRIVHRDLTPSNIFIDAHNNIKIGDFGLACSLDGVDNEKEIEDLAFLFYRAPEMSEHVTEKVDMYSLGVILFQLYYPFGSDSEKSEILGKLTKKKQVDEEVWVTRYSKQFALIKKLISSDPDDRPSARRVLDDLISSHLEN